MEVKRAYITNNLPLQPDENDQYPECPFGVKNKYADDCNMSFQDGCNPSASCFPCETCCHWQVTRINSLTCRRCVYYIQEFESQVICGHPHMEPSKENL